MDPWAGKCQMIHSSFHRKDLENTLVYCFWRGCGARRMKELECFQKPLWKPPTTLGLERFVCSSSIADNQEVRRDHRAVCIQPADIQLKKLRDVFLKTIN